MVELRGGNTVRLTWIENVPTPPDPPVIKTLGEETPAAIGSFNYCVTHLSEGTKRSRVLRG